MATIQLPVTILPLEVPDSVKIMSDVSHPISGQYLSHIPIDRLSYENLDSICNEFRKNMFEIAKVQDKKPIVYRKIDTKQLEFGGQ